MKHTLYVLLFLGFCHSLLTAQIGGTVIYNYGYEEALKERFAKSEGLSKETKRLLLESEDIKVKLKFTQFKSIYTYENKLTRDNSPVVNLNIPSAGGRKIYFNDIKKGISIIQECELFDKCYLIENQTPQWELINESKTIGGYLCLKAQLRNSNSKKVTTAWYAPEIAVPFGPMEYLGLPGLILLLQTPRGVFTADSIELNYEQNQDITGPDKGEHISHQAYQQLLRKMYLMNN